MKQLILFSALFLSLSMSSQKFSTDRSHLEKLRGNKLDVPHIYQLQSNWCWAACAAMIINYYDEINIRPCEIVSKEFNYDCCRYPNQCNQTNYTTRLLAITKPYNIKSKGIEGRLSWKQITDHLDKDELVLLRIKSDYGAGHVLIAFGYYELFNHKTGFTARMLDFYDPTYESINGSEISFTRSEFTQLKNGNSLPYKFEWVQSIRFDGN
jgi:hypothetical protein